MIKKWTVRGIDTHVIAMAKELAAFNSMTLGDCVSEAIRQWHDSLPEQDPAWMEIGQSVPVSGNRGQTVNVGTRV